MALAYPPLLFRANNFTVFLVLASLTLPLVMTMSVPTHADEAGTSLPEEIPAPAVTAAEARHMLSILRDEKKRGELEQALSAIAQAAEASTTLNAAVPASPEATESSPEPVVRETGEGGAQLVEVIGNRLEVASDQLRLTAGMLLEARTVAGWWQSTTLARPSVACKCSAACGRS
ncbi:MAG: hypothetical protein H0X43_03150 [Nitrosospira sp.]|nr:hypothetical protein [Nitrosospira sp.]